MSYEEGMNHLKDGHKKNPNKTELFPQQTIDRLIKKSVEPKRNKDGVIIISKDEMSYEEWGEWSVYCDANTCTKCTVKPIVKEHLCDECYESHNKWLRELSTPKQDSEGMMTERYYKVKSLIPNMTFNILKKKDGAGNVDWFLSENNHWGIEPDIDGYFTKKEINNLEPVLRDFVLSKFCVLEEL